MLEFSAIETRRFTTAQVAQKTDGSKKMLTDGFTTAQVAQKYSKQQG